MYNVFRLLQYARRQRVFFVLIPILTIIAAGLSALQPWPMALLIDQVLGKRPLPPVLLAGFHAVGITPKPSALLAVIVIGGLALFILNSAVDAWLTWAWTVAGRRMVYDLAGDLFARLQRCSLLFHKRHAVGDTMGRVTVDSWCVYQVVDTFVFAPGHALLTIAGMIFLMAKLDATLTVLALVVAPLMVVASLGMGKPLRAAARMKREIESRIQAHIQQTLTGIPVVQTFAQEERESLRFRTLADAAIRSQRRSAVLGSINSLSSGLITTLGSGIILWVGARHVVLAGSLSVGGILIFLVYLNSLQTQTKVLAGLYTAFQGLSASTRRAVEVLDAAPEVADKPAAPPLPPVRQSICFQNVTAGYEPGRPVLQSISLEVEVGQTIAIVGPTGSGKTTLVNLIPRFMDPWEGAVLIDGHDLREVRLKSLRRQIALVLQESFLFPISIAENIAYGRPSAKREEIEAAARAASAHGFITALPNGYDTLIGERGATLSGGERQRLAIARAFLKDAPVLILDEPTSALDSDTERQVLNALQRLMAGRTTFVVAHRLSTARCADRIVVLKDGRIAEGGTHEELLARGGPYARLHDIQNQFGSPAAAASP